MKISEKLEANWKAGLYTLVKNTAHNQFTLFTTKDRDGDLRRSDWRCSENYALYSDVDGIGIRPRALL